MPQDYAMQLPPHEVPAFVASSLQAGFKQEEIAAALGCSPSYISQVLAANPQLAAAAQQADSQYEDIDAAYDRIERNALECLEKSLSTISDPMKLLRVASEVNRAKRRSHAPKGALETQAPNSSTTVQLQMSTAILQRFVFNEANQAVALKTVQPNGTEAQTRMLVTATQDQLKELAAEYAQAQAPSIADM